MKCLLLCLSLFAANNAFSAIVSVGSAAPVALPNGRVGSTPTATYRTVHQLSFSLSAAQTVMFLTTSDLYLRACSGTGIAGRCPLGESISGNQRILVINKANKAIVYQEIFKYALSAGTVYPSGTPANEKATVISGVNETSSLHGVANLNAGNYELQLQVRNDFYPMTIHPKRLTVSY